MYYTITPVSAQAHTFDVTTTVQHVDRKSLIFRLPAWVPGSYMVRDFSRHLNGLTAVSNGKQLTVQQIDKASWQIDHAEGEVKIQYQIYAFDLSVRGAYLDTERGFFNGSSVFVYADGHTDETCTIEILSPPETALGHATWQVATPLVALQVNENGFGLYQASNYEQLIDQPVELGHFKLKPFLVGGIEHRLIVSGNTQGDLDRLAADCQQICATQIAFFGNAAPFKRYDFFLYVDKGLYGGLEHCDSTALMCDPKCLPRSGDQPVTDDYLTLLGLISHEYFHAWNVKRIKPAAFKPYDLTKENYTRLLWAFEGITSYYDDLFLVRSGLINKAQYLGLLAKTITAYERNLGRLKQTLEDSSFNAWTKFYHPNENTPNSVVSYYTKGAMAALCLDLYIRDQTQNKYSIDDIMQVLWNHSQMTGYRGVAENEWESIAETLTGLSLCDVFNHFLRSTQPLPLKNLLEKQGVELHLTSANSSDDKGGLYSTVETQPTYPSLGVQGVKKPEGYVLKYVFDEGAGQQAGLSAGDILLSLNGNRIDDLDAQLKLFRVDDKVEIHFFHGERLLKREVLLQAAARDTCRLQLIDDKSAAWLTETNF